MCATVGVVLPASPGCRSLSAGGPDALRRFQWSTRDRSADRDPFFEVFQLIDAAWDPIALISLAQAGVLGNDGALKW